MKRSAFLTSLVAFCGAPSIKEERKTEPFVIRHVHRISARDHEYLRTTNVVGMLDCREKYIEHVAGDSIGKLIMKSDQLRRTKVINPDGSVDYQFLLML